MKLKDLELGKLFVAKEPYSKHEDFYMKIQCSYEGSNAVRLRDGITIQLNAFADVTELGVDLVEYLNGIHADVIERSKVLDQIKQARTEIFEAHKKHLLANGWSNIMIAVEIMDKLITEVEKEE